MKRYLGKRPEVVKFLNTFDPCWYLDYSIGFVERHYSLVSKVISNRGRSPSIKNHTSKNRYEVAYLAGLLLGFLDEKRRYI